MSQIKITQIQSATSNGDLTITPNGTGIFEIAGNDNGATLQFNDASETYKVKLKSPPSSAGQNYTLTLPEADIEADRFLQVGTITGSGSTAVAQLQYASVTEPDLTELNASNFTTGTVSTDRYSLTGSIGAGYQLIQKQAPTSSVTSISFTNLVDGGLYRLIIKNLVSDIDAQPRMDLLNASGTGYVGQIQFDMYSSTGSYNVFNYDRNDIEMDVGNSYKLHHYVAEIYTATPISGQTYNNPNFVILRGCGFTGSAVRKNEVYASFTGDVTDRIHGIKIFLYTGNASTATFENGTELLLYKYNES